ncbi:MAG: hypothetical protein WAP03_24145 [Methylorubrum rhodinum]|uniref:hypothetical protein n=1 Tax=Methylorubrum rhodinum TaxID=29428 RepID=UPI003BB14DD1
MLYKSRSDFAQRLIAEEWQEVYTYVRGFLLDVIGVALAERDDFVFVQKGFGGLPEGRAGGRSPAPPVRRCGGFDIERLDRIVQHLATASVVSLDVV